MATSLIILSFFLLITSSAVVAAASITDPIQSFTQCFLNSSSSSGSPVIYSTASTSYQSILQSDAQNFRFLLSTTNRKPSAIVTATLESHVSLSVTCARKNGLSLRVRSGGHDYEAMSYVSIDGVTPFVLLDLAALRSVTLDVPHQTAWVQAGATLGELYYSVFTGTNGKFGFAAGTCPTVGVGGHISGGGQGYITRKFGLAADNLVDARIVTVDGRVLDRTAMGEDLFWAIRGGGAASFGVVVSYKVTLAPVPPVVTVFSVSRTLNQNATKLVTRWQTIAPKFDKNLFVRVVAQGIDDGSAPGGRNIQALFSSLFLGNRSSLLSTMAVSFPELGLKAEDCSEMNWLESILFFNYMQNQGVSALLDRTRKSNGSSKCKSDYVTQPIGAQQWGNIWNFLMQQGKGKPAGLIMEPYGGRMDEIPATATPFPHRIGNLYNIQYYLDWTQTDSATTQNNLDYMTKLYAFMAPYVSSNPRAAYYNYKDIDLGRNSDGNSTSYSQASVWGVKYFKGNFQRLATVKGRVDPQNFFRNEQSIPPLPLAH